VTARAAGVNKTGLYSLKGMEILYMRSKGKGWKRSKKEDLINEENPGDF
jgi:hypothetical protein